MAQRLGVDVPVLADTTAEVAKAFGIYDLPGSMGPYSTHSFWLLDRDGQIRFGVSRVSRPGPRSVAVAAARARRLAARAAAVRARLGHGRSPPLRQRRTPPRRASRPPRPGRRRRRTVPRPASARRRST